MTLWDSLDESEPDESSADATWGVAELGDAIGRALGGAFGGEVWLRGEIRSIRPPNRNGHQYFDLVEPGAGPGETPRAKISVTLFSGRRRHVLKMLADGSGDSTLTDGVEVRIRGQVNWWGAGGKLNFLMSGIDPVFTLGQLDAQRRALLAELEKKDLLDANARLVIPVLPLRIGLVTSAGSAAHADFMKEIDASGYAFDVVLADARVQGAEAPTTLVAAISKVTARGVDVIAVVRGGGSRTDLVAFDHGEVAYAIARSPVPVFTGIGHEIDRSVADEVAAVACKTPTAAAAALVARVADAEAALSARGARIAAVAQRSIDAARTRLEGRLEQVARAAHVADTRATSHLTAQHRRLTTATRRSLADARRATDRRQARVGPVAATTLARATERLDAAATGVRAYDPKRILARGWSLTRTGDGTLLRMVDRVSPGEVLVTTLATGTITSTVDATDAGDSSGEPTDILWEDRRS